VVRYIALQRIATHVKVDANSTNCESIFGSPIKSIFGEWPNKSEKVMRNHGKYGAETGTIPQNFILSTATGDERKQEPMQAATH
jgi:hypothetical protein